MSIFYCSLRIGRYGRPFYMWKFRTMIERADKVGGANTPADDWRITRSGKWLRKWQIDELPQLINILKGEMSIVGPRPEVPKYVELMSDKEKRIILSVRPGLTDLATLANMSEGERLRGSQDPERKYLEDIRPEKIRLQIEYVKSRSLLLDLKIIFKTLCRIIH